MSALGSIVIIKNNKSKSKSKATSELIKTKTIRRNNHKFERALIAIACTYNAHTRTYLHKMREYFFIATLGKYGKQTFRFV